MREHSGGTERPKPSFRAKLWSDTAILVYLGLAKLLIHLAFNGRYGYFRDELYSLVCGERLDFGYVDHPPLIPLLARVSKAMFGDSLLGLRLFPAVAGAVTVVLAGLIVRRLGGRRWAQVLTAVSVIVSAVILNFGYLLTNNALDIMFWTLTAYLLIVIIQDKRPRLWLAWGAAAGLALQNKYSIAFFVAGLGIGFLLTSARSELRKVWPWAGAAAAFLIILPNLLWQVRHGLPFIELNRNAVLHKNAILSPLQFLGGQLQEASLLVLPLILAGFLFFLLAPSMKPFRFFGWAYLALFAFFVFSGGKPYYLAAVYPLMIAGGAALLERGIARTRRAWLKPLSLILVVMAGAVSAPFALPILPVDRLIVFGQFLGVTPAAGERLEMGALPQHFADQFGWAEMTDAVARIYGGLTEADQKECSIFAQNYGEASALIILGRSRGLPPAISGHNNYWVWGPGRGSGRIMIVIGGRAEDYRRVFDQVTEAGRTKCPLAMPYENDLPIFVCRGLRVPLDVGWPQVRHFI